MVTVREKKRVERRRRNEEMVLKKGPWTAEEDKVLLDYVRVHGPQEWSSIRSKGLLPRSGKSCRLRWVNKLRPNLKSGCKFSPEEERVVIELQAEFGNKWARIATYLTGRTDNDVKNFWSTRQKRLTRLLSSSQKKSRRNGGKVLLGSAEENRALQDVGRCESFPYGECSSSRDSADRPEEEEDEKLYLPELDGTLPQLQICDDVQPISTFYGSNLNQSDFPPLPPGLGFVDMGLHDPFLLPDLGGFGSDPFIDTLTFTDPGGTLDGTTMDGVDEILFDDLPMEMLDGGGVDDWLPVGLLDF